VSPELEKAGITHPLFGPALGKLYPQKPAKGKGKGKAAKPIPARPAPAKPAS
jgi:hypothetical protein